MGSQMMTSPTRCSGERAFPSGSSSGQAVIVIFVWSISLCPIKSILLTPHNNQWLPSPSLSSRFKCSCRSSSTGLG